MKTITLDKTTHYIWTPKALTGPGLTPAANILIRITGGIIRSMETIPPDKIPPDISGHKNFICMEENITLMPSLTDAHVHLALNGQDGKEIPPGIRQSLEDFLAHGIGTVRDGGDINGINLKVRNMISNAALNGPRVIATGQAIRRNGSYGSFLGSGYSDPPEIPPLTDRLLSWGVDQIKIIVSGIVSFKEYGRVGPALITPGELRNITERAHSRGVKVMAHASSDEAAEMAVEAGVDSIEHGYFITKQTLKKMAFRQIAWVPTLIPVSIHTREPLSASRSKKEIDIITRTYEEQMQKLPYALEAGVPLGLGTDSGAPGVKHATSLIEEILLYSHAGLSPCSVLQSVTTVNARILGLEGRGIEVNSTPRMTGVKGNPLEDLNALGKISRHFID